MKTLRISTTDLIRTFCKLVHIDSEDMKCAGMVRYLKEFKTPGLPVKIREQKTGEFSNIIYYTGPKSGEKPLMLAAHMDTVSPGKKIHCLIKRDRIVSSGNTVLGSDNKAAIAVYLYALKLAARSKLKIRPLELVFTYGEEKGLLGARNLDYSLIRSRRGICMDSEGDVGLIARSAPFYMKFEITVTGKASHSGINPEKGVNAIAALSSVITRIKQGRLDKTTTMNIGLISGGRALNIVSDQAKAEGEIRAFTLDRVKKLLNGVKDITRKECEKSGARCRVTGFLEFKGFRIGKNDPFLLETVEILERIGVRVSLKDSNGGSDANIFNAHGIRTINLGVGMERAHTTKEFIRVKNLLHAAQFVLYLITQEEVEVRI